MQAPTTRLEIQESALNASPTLLLKHSRRSNMKDNEQSEFWQKQLAAEPDNYVNQMLVRITTPARSYHPSKSPEIEEQDPMKLGREGEVLLELYPTGIPYKLTSNGKDCPHVFLMFNGQPLDICGITSLAEMGDHYKIDFVFAKEMSFQEMQKLSCGRQTPEDKRRLKAHFREYIIKNVGERFPPPETQNPI
jgi:hypothetical protein